ncbi:MAG: hypothetical protein AAF609_22405 [Cyanobacteria bacterium P01_C01_bin.120]
MVAVVAEKNAGPVARQGLKGLQSVSLAHSKLGHDDEAICYLVKAMHQVEAETLMAWVAIPAWIEPSLRRRTVERVVRLHCFGFIVPGRGDTPWWVEVQEESGFDGANATR